VTNKISGAKMSRGLPFPFFCLLHCLMCWLFSLLLALCGLFAFGFAQSARGIHT
jgi:hypothetical protein